METEKFIVYACPTGELYQQIETYYQISQTTCGENSAHQYMPHCSLTGFFEASTDDISVFIEALNQTYQQRQKQKISLSLQVLGMMFKSEWQGLELEGKAVKHLIHDFIQKIEESNLTVNIRPKDWLHLSLAYGFQPQHYLILKQLAQEYVNPQTSTEWELRFYQRHYNGEWTCHSTWVLEN
jgi:ubiquitin-associated SH3 domain-containing protein